MTKTLRFPLFAATLALSVGALPVSPASALTIYCTNCATTFQQATQMAKEIETAINTAATLQNQISQYNEMLKQGMSLPSSMFNRMTGDLQQLQSLYQQSKALSGGLSNFDTQFRSQFQGYDSYLAQSGKSSSYMGDNYRRWNEQGFDNMRTAMRAAGMNVSSISDEDALLSQLVQRSQSASGRMQAVQAGNEIAAQQVQQMMKLRQLLNTQIQSQSMWYAQQMERQTVDDAGRQQFYSVKSRRGPSVEF
jgi:P-type conjugative transfer protein TrbJ